MIRIVLAMACLALIAAVPAYAADPAPNFSLSTGDGKTVALSKLRGQVVVVNLWATWCGPCRSEIPGMLEVYNQYRSKGLEIVGISLDRDGWRVVNPFVEKMKITYPVVLGNGQVAEAYGGIEAIPTTFVVDRKGNVAARHVGYLSKAEFEKIVKKAL
jgi:cytochrome c biogenesis protein CcmG/thiol:disulfide interchange protein DsbE